MTRKRHDVVIVGAGLFGAMATRFAHEDGHNVTVVDSRRQYRASQCSGCVIAPSWLSALTKDQIRDGRALLQEYYGLETLEFQGNLGTTFKAERVVTKDVLTLSPAIKQVDGAVLSVFSGGVNLIHKGTGKPETLRGKVLVAAGIWCGELLSGLPAIRGLYGASLLISGQIPQPRLNVYAPYRQAVAFNMDKKHVWFGDGTALIEKTWDREEQDRIEATVERAERLGIVLSTRTLTVRSGARPYIEKRMGYYDRINNSLYVSTGGAKNGTMLAALQAHQFVKDLEKAR